MRIRKRLSFSVIMVILTVVSGLYYGELNVLSKRVDNIQLKVSENTVKAEEVKFDIYIPNKELTKLEIKTVTGKYTDDKNETVKIVVDSVSKNLIERGVIKNKIEVLNSFFSGKDLYINLKSIDEFNDGSKKVLYILYSMSNSIIELGGVERVKFLVNNGEKSGVFEQYYQKNTDL